MVGVVDILYFFMLQISVSTELVVELADKYLEGGATANLAALRARDVLRLEAGLCLSIYRRRPHPLRRASMVH